MADGSEVGGPPDAGQFAPRPLPPRAPLAAEGATRARTATATAPRCCRSSTPDHGRRPVPPRAARTAAGVRGSGCRRPAGPRDPDRFDGSTRRALRRPGRPRRGGGRGASCCGCSTARPTRGSSPATSSSSTATSAGWTARRWTAAVADLADRYRSADVEVKAPDGGFGATAPELGMSVDPDATADAALDVGHEGFLVAACGTGPPASWSSSKAPVVARRRRERGAQAGGRARPASGSRPSSPTSPLKDGKIVAVEGKPGRGIDPVDVLRALRSKAGPAVPAGGLRRPEVGPAPVRHRRRRAAGRRGGAARRRRAAGDRSRATTATVPAATVRTWLRGMPSDEGLRLGIDADGAAEALAALFPEAGKPAGRRRLRRSSGGEVVDHPGPGGHRLLRAGGGHRHRGRRSATGSPGDPAVDLPLKTIARGPRRGGGAQAGRQGDRRQLHHQPRRRRAPGHQHPPHRRHRPGRDHRARGARSPSTTTSAERTIAKGFVEAPVIDAEYKFSKDVGGGVSQFSTTLFNAAFFAGLDIPTYGMHGIYISRYPYGREATLDFPSLDLKVRNSTPYGVLDLADVQRHVDHRHPLLHPHGGGGPDGPDHGGDRDHPGDRDARPPSPATARPRPRPVRPHHRAAAGHRAARRRPSPRSTCAPGSSPSAPAPTSTGARRSTASSPCTPPRKA